MIMRSAASRGKIAGTIRRAWRMSNPLGPHPEVLARLGEPRRMATSSVSVAILRDASLRSAPQDEGGACCNLAPVNCPAARASDIGGAHSFGGKQMADLPRLNGIIRALEAGQP